MAGSSFTQPKKALRRFVKADGVTSLSELLKLWSTADTAESGVLVTLKVSIAAQSMLFFASGNPNFCHDWLCRCWRCCLGSLGRS
jgi:hypothetical protein